MYRVNFNGFPLHDLRDERLVLRDPDTHLAVGEAGSMRFLIDADHPHANQLTRLKGVLELWDDRMRIFKGRIRKDTRDFLLSREIEVEGLLACLNDSIIPPFNFPEDFQDDADYQAAAESGNVVKFFLGWLLDQHNSQVTGSAQKIQLGEVTVADPNNFITRASSEYLTTMDVVRKKLEQLMGGYLLADYSGDTTVLHYYADLPLTNIQTVEFGENLLDLVTILDSAETYTAILPIGADGLTIAGLPDGEISPGIWKIGRIIYSQEAEEAVDGRITRTVVWDDVTLAENLQTKATALLTGEGVMTAQTISVRAADLGPLEGLPRFVVGRHVQLNSTPHGFSAAYPLMELEPDLLDPGNTEITMGATFKSSTDIAHKNQMATEERQNQQQIELEEQKGSLTELAQTTLTQITSAIQTCESIIFSALEDYIRTSDFETYQQTVQSQLSILSDEIALRFTEVTERVTEVDGDLQKTVETLTKHFEFGLDGLVIKAGEHAMQLKLDNGLILFMRDGQQFGWWDGVDFHTGNIIIDVTERAQFGNFAFVPRSNGSLSFLKVSG